MCEGSQVPCYRLGKVLSKAGIIRLYICEGYVIGKQEKHTPLEQEMFLDFKTLLFQDEEAFLEEMFSKGWRQYVPGLDGNAFQHMFYH